ncbi:hypothetical protein [Bradyrhizobium liaoningense]|jgi:hypothetical protein
MVSNKELEAGLKAMADDFHLPGGGRKKLSRLVVGYLWWFDAAEQRGMSWQDMIRAMTAAGVTGRGAKPISVGTLSSTVWRVRTKDREASGAPEQERLGQAPILPIGQPLRSTKSRGSRQTQQGRRKASPQNDDGALTDRPASKRSAGGDRLGRANKDVLAFMDRARAVRRRSEDD